MLKSGGQTVFKNRVGWAKTYLKKAGLLDSPRRAAIVITETGKRVVEENPPRINSRYLIRFPSFREFLASTNSPEGTAHLPEPSAPPTALAQDDLTPDDQLGEAYRQINASLASDLLDEVMKMDSRAFGKLVVDLLSKMGYGTIACSSHDAAASGDDGIDGVIMEDKLGFSLIYMQVKKWAQDHVVGQPEIQSFLGAITGRNGHGLFVTTSGFSRRAQEFADAHHIILIDGGRLVNLMIEYNFCVSVRKTFEIKSIDTDALSEYQDE